MGKIYSSLTESLQHFAREQHIFFVATAPLQGRINLSPKGLESFYILSPTRVLFLNLVGSGNETAGHLLEEDRITLMFCSFTEEPQILRIYGRGKAIHPEEADYEKLAAYFTPQKGMRQIIDIAVDSAQTSCGYGVPLFEFQTERKRLTQWIADKTPLGIARYQDKNNRFTIDGKSTGLPASPIDPKT